MIDTILIADDHEIVRQGIRMIIQSFPRNYQIVEASSCREVTAILSSQPVSYAVVDMQLNDGNFFTGVHDYVSYIQKISILVYTMNAENIYAKRLLQKGVKGFLSKSEPLEELKEALRCLLKGEVYLSAKMQEALARPSKSDRLANPINALSERELEVVEYLSRGLGIKEISVRMKLDMTTISTYRRRAYTKLGAQNAFDLREKFLFYKNVG